MSGSGCRRSGARQQRQLELERRSAVALGYDASARREHRRQRGRELPAEAARIGGMGGRGTPDRIDDRRARAARRNARARWRRTSASTPSAGQVAPDRRDRGRRGVDQRRLGGPSGERLDRQRARAGEQVEHRARPSTSTEDREQRLADAVRRRPRGAARGARPSVPPPEPAPAITDAHARIGASASAPVGAHERIGEQRVLGPARGRDPRRRSRSARTRGRARAARRRAAARRRGTGPARAGGSRPARPRRAAARSISASSKPSACEASARSRGESLGPNSRHSDGVRAAADPARAAGAAARSRSGRRPRPASRWRWGRRSRPRSPRWRRARRRAPEANAAIASCLSAGRIWPCISTTPKSRSSPSRRRSNSAVAARAWSAPTPRPAGRPRTPGAPRAAPRGSARRRGRARARSSRRTSGSAGGPRGSSRSTVKSRSP